MINEATTGTGASLAATSDRDTGRFYLLDGMRGIAALLVVCMHFEGVGFRIVQSGFLAVDFFFALSGFVIAQAYEARLSRGMTARKFTELRVVRLYPLYFAGFLIGFVKRFAGFAAHRAQSMSGFEILIATIFGGFMLPTPLKLFELFPLNGPSWSLFLELSINILYAVALVRLSRRSLIVVVAAGGVAMVVGAYGFGSINLGWSWGTLAAGFGRTLFSFPIGVACARVLSKSRRPTWLSAIAPAVLIGCLSYDPAALDARVAYDLAVTALVSPGLLVLGIQLEIPAAGRRVAAFLGDISYPVYAIHFPLLYAVAGPMARAGIRGWPAVVVFLGFACGLSALLSRVFDQPVRRWIGGQLKARSRRATLMPS